MRRNRGNCSRPRLPSRSNLHSASRVRMFNIAGVTLATAESSDVFKASAFAAEYP